MPKVVEVPGIGNVEFPEAMSDQEISAAIRNRLNQTSRVGGQKVLDYTNQMLANIPSSAARFVGDIATAVGNPKETAAALGGLGLGLSGAPAYRQNVNALVNLYKQRYGGWDQFTETLKTDPVGVLADLSALADAAGGATKSLQIAADAAKASRLADVAGTASRTARTVSEATSPILIPKQAVQAAATAAQVPQYLYRTALRGGYEVRTPIEDVRQLARTGLASSLPVTESGVRRLYDLLVDLNQDVNRTIQAGSQRGLTLDTEKIARYAEDVKPQFETVTRESSQRPIQRVQDEFTREWGPQPAQPAGLVNAQGQPIQSTLQGWRPMPVGQGQAIKVNTYRELQNEFGKMSTAEVEAKKALARGIKDELVAALPELSALNAKEAKLLDLSPVLEKAVNKASNATGGGLKTLITSGVAKGITESNKLAVAAGLIQMVLNDPAVCSHLAIALNYGQRARPATRAGATIGTALSRIQEYEDQLRQIAAGSQQ